MSCRTCKYVYQRLYSLGNGMYGGQLFCQAQKEAPEVNPDDICEHYKDRFSKSNPIPSEDEPATSKEAIEMHKAPIVIQEAPLEESPKYDPVSHPDHYTSGRKFEPKDVIRDWNLNFNLGNAVKYISRAGRKNDLIEDLKKARQYLDFEIEYLEKKFGERF